MFCKATKGWWFCFNAVVDVPVIPEGTELYVI